ncbi:hypothetical protein AB5I41_07355 [Sphingomonas sp. MMS24-JH45]
MVAGGEAAAVLVVVELARGVAQRARHDQPVPAPAERGGDEIARRLGRAQPQYD